MWILGGKFCHLVGLVGLEKLAWLEADSRDSRRFPSYSSPGSNGMLPSIKHQNMEKELKKKKHLSAPSCRLSWLLFSLKAFT